MSAKYYKTVKIGSENHNSKRNVANQEISEPFNNRAPLHVRCKSW